MQSLEPVMATLAEPETDLDGFVKELGDAARIVAPVSGQNAQLFTGMADTFEALGRDEQALKDFIAKSPPTMDTAISSFRVQRPFLTDLTAFSKDFAGATEELKGALPPLNDAIRVGTPVQRRLPTLNEETAKTLVQLRKLAEAPGTNAALRGLTATVTTLNPQLRFYGPYVTVCNSFNYFFTFLAEHFSEPDTTGSAQRALVNRPAARRTRSARWAPTSPPTARACRRARRSTRRTSRTAPPWRPDGRADCEAGQRGYVERDARFFPSKYKIARDPRSPGLQGPTFAGRPRVPEGQTFTAEPETGEYADMPKSERP